VTRFAPGRQQFARSATCVVFLTSLFYGSSSTAQASCAVGATAPTYILEAKAIAVSPNKTSATFQLIKVRKGRFPWKKFAATSYANLSQDLEATTIPPDPDHPPIYYVPLFEPGATYSLWGNRVTKVSTFRGQRVRLDILGICSQTRQLSPAATPTTSVAPS
jgi:hypothetical protein